MHQPTDNNKISLIVATVGRVDELDRMLASMAKQTQKHFELIVVDQNTDDRVKDVLKSWESSFQCIHVRSDLGASKARNLGIHIAHGDIIGFPDDDCWYPTDLLQQVKGWFEQHPSYDFLCCSAQDENCEEVASRWPRHSGKINRTSVLRACACSAFFVRREAATKVGGFDETMGPGPEALVQSAEEADFALRLMRYSHFGWFEKHIHINHPRKEAGSGSSNRAFSYAVALGFLLRRHNYPLYTWIYHVTRPIVGAICALFTASPQKAFFYWKSACGRTIGYFHRAALRKTLI
jgi:glycosyltransferase involved in cell wall biosynthesis